MKIRISHCSGYGLGAVAAGLFVGSPFLDFGEHRAPKSPPQASLTMPSTATSATVAVPIVYRTVQGAPVSVAALPRTLYQFAPPSSGV